MQYLVQLRPSSVHAIADPHNESAAWDPSGACGTDFPPRDEDDNWNDIADVATKINSANKPYFHQKLPALCRICERRKYEFFQLCFWFRKYRPFEILVKLLFVTAVCNTCCEFIRSFSKVVSGLKLSLPGPTRIAYKRYNARGPRGGSSQ